jgi:hypothetical protein
MVRRVVDARRQALPWEVTGAARWYDEARQVAARVGDVAHLDVVAGAAVVAALSPMNKWADNCADALALAADRGSRVRTTGPNRAKAVAILDGADPGEVLSGRKVRNFWRAVATAGAEGEVPVDRHLYRVAVGWTVSPYDAAPRGRAEYDRVVGAYETAASWLGERALVVGAVAWYVARRTLGRPGIRWAGDVEQLDLFGLDR